MKTTLGQLVSELFDAYERRHGDPDLAALATQVTVNELLIAGDGRSRARVVRTPASRPVHRRATRQAA